MKLFVFDIDNTVTTGPSVWEVVHKELGTWNQGQKFLKQFLKKEINFVEFAKKDVACWQGISTQRLLEIFSLVQLRAGLYELLEYLKKQNIKTAVLSSSLKQFVDFLDADFDYIVANPLKIKDDRLSGEIDTRLCCFEKGHQFMHILDHFGFMANDCGGIGDSEYDLPFLEQVKYAFCCGDKLHNDKLLKVDDFFDVKTKLESVL